MTDTIAAISTALGEGGIAIVRISGPDAVFLSEHVLARKDFPEHGRLYLTSLIDENGSLIDRVLAVNFRAPKSYTGEDIVEIHTHGGILIARTCLELILKNGARIAEPGEFTRRAFVNGRMDLSQAEGVLGIIRSRSIEALHASARTLTGELSRVTHKIHDDVLALQAGLEVLLDFPEGEVLDGLDVHAGIRDAVRELEELIARCSAGMILRDGIRVVIAGSPNVGKSSLMNAMLGRDRAIVTDIAGTTRDIIDESIIINGVPVTLSDTAGLRDSDDVIESLGVSLARQAMNQSDICVYVIDSSREVTSQELETLSGLVREGRRVIAVLSKSDLEAKTPDIDIACEKLRVSSRTHDGIDDLKARIYSLACSDSAISSGLNASVAQMECLRESLSALREAEDCVSEDVLAGLLGSARMSLLRVLGVDAGDELLDSMFSRFCVGK